MSVGSVEAQDDRHEQGAVASLAERSARPDGAAATHRRRLRRIVVAAPVLVLVSWVTFSYATWMLRPSSLSWRVNTVEWVRYKAPFGNWLADQVEQRYYSWKAPKKGGPARKTLPPVGVTQAQPGPTQQAGVWPPPIQPVFPQPLAGEGIWNPTGPMVDGGPPVLLTTYRPELAYPRQVAYVAWFDATRTQLAYYPGRYEPPRAAVRGPLMVPESQRSRLLATFNGGFTYVDGHNGSTDNGQTNEPLKDGNATLVAYRDGRVDIVKWSGGPDAGPDVASSRQSLAPIVWDGAVNPALNDKPNSAQWGYSLGGRTRVWRTGAGIDARGNLIYVAADGQTVITLAKILQHVGAVRAMELDINPEWHTLITYAHDPDLVPTMVGPNPMQSSHRYLVPDDRDFFAIYEPVPGPVTVPFE